MNSTPDWVLRIQRLYANLTAILRCILAVPLLSSNSSLFSSSILPLHIGIVTLLGRTDESRNCSPVTSSPLASVAGLGTGVTARFGDWQGRPPARQGIGNPGRSRQQRVLGCSHASSLRHRVDHDTGPSKQESHRQVLTKIQQSHHLLRSFDTATRSVPPQWTTTAQQTGQSMIGRSE